MNSLLRFSLAVLILVALPHCTLLDKAGTKDWSTVRQPAETHRVLLEEALADADHASMAGLETQAERQVYDDATERVVTHWLALRGTKTTATDMPISKGYRIKASWPAGFMFDDLVSARNFEKGKLRTRVTRDGIGVPFLAHWNPTPERRAMHPFMNDAGHVVSVTATLDFSGADNRTARLVLHDPREEETVRIARRSFPLAADFSLVGEWVLRAAGEQEGLTMPGLGALRHSSHYLDKLGLICLEPVSRDRIPVIFVHGLMSRPLTWQNAFNELAADPVVRKRYQFFFFRYPTGVPVIYSAAKLREKLGMLHDELERLGNDRFADQMVLIGHSMGGLVSKSQVQDSGDRLWVNVFGSTPDLLKFSKEEIDGLRAYLEYKANPYVSRVIFVATPHRGSALAAGTLGAIGRRLISLPGKIMGDAFSIVLDHAAESGPLHELLKRGVPTSIDNLSPNSQFVQTSISLPLRSGLHVHSIIGNKKQKPLNDPSCSDGFVPYTSAHLDGVESELIVPYGHSAHEHPQAIQEITRILNEHVRKL